MNMHRDELDEGVRRFVTEVNQSYAALRPDGPWTAAAMRRIAEIVREPWRKGGPAMHETTERLVPTQHGHVRIRLHRPTAGGPKPALIYMHGGGFTIFSLDTHDRVMREFAARADMVVIGVDYALSPEAKFPVALEQTVAVLRWVAQHARELDVDASRLAVGGDSAGGNLSMGAALALRDGGEPHLLRAILTAYGGFGGLISDEMQARYGGAGYMLTREETLFFWSQYLEHPDDRGNPLASTLGADLRRLPACFMVIAECDINYEQNMIMAARLKEAGVAVRAEVYRGATHSFLEAVSVSAVAERAFRDSAGWLREVMRSSPAGACE